MVRGICLLICVCVITGSILLFCGGTVYSQGNSNLPVIVGFHNGTDASAVRAAGGHVTKEFTIIPAIAADLPPQAVEALRRNPKIAYIEEDRLLHAVYSSGETSPWGILRVGADAVYDLGNSGSGVKVAVLDTGIDASHPDLAANYTGGYDFYSDDAVPNDENGHGTHVSGTIAAADNGLGVVGVGPSISLYALKFLDASGNGYTSDEISAIQWAIANGIKVLNMSFGSYSRSLSEQKALDNAYNAGMVLVAAAGNDGAPWKLFPASYSSVIAVAATDQSNSRASFSNYYSDVELAAPGVGVYSTTPTYVAYLNLLGYSSNYDYLSGTSMATPHVAAAAALVSWQNPGWSAQQIRDRLNSTATDLGPAGRDTQYGYGLVNVEAACGSVIPPPPSSTGSVTGTVYLNGQPVNKANVSLLNQDGIAVASAKTNSSGVYVFLSMPADSSTATYFTATARSGKYRDTSSPIDLSPGETAVCDLNLR